MKARTKLSIAAVCGESWHFELCNKRIETTKNLKMAVHAAWPREGSTVLYKSGGPSRSYRHDRRIAAIWSQRATGKTLSSRVSRIQCNKALTQMVAACCYGLRTSRGITFHSPVIGLNLCRKIWSGRIV